MDDTYSIYYFDTRDSFVFFSNVYFKIDKKPEQEEYTSSSSSLSSKQQMTKIGPDKTLVLESNSNGSTAQPTYHTQSSFYNNLNVSLDGGDGRTSTGIFLMTDC
jgi:hypothetical protein